MKDLPVEFIKRLNSITAKRPATIIKHILANGYITSEEIKDIYGYSHPPRAIRDVREQGIPIETYRVKDNSGRSIAAYKFGNPSSMDDKISKVHGKNRFCKSSERSFD